MATVVAYLMACVMANFDHELLANVHNAVLICRRWIRAHCDP